MANFNEPANYNPVRTFEQPSGGFWEWLFGSPERIQQIQQFNPQQQMALSNLLQMGLGGLKGLQSQYKNFGQSTFEPIAEQARNQFETQGIPSLAERFTYLGGGQRSSAFPAALGAARAGLERDLASLGAQFGQRQQALQLQGLGQYQNLISNLLNSGLTPQYETIGRPATGGAYQAAGERAYKMIPLIGQYF